MIAILRSLTAALLLLQPGIAVHAGETRTVVFDVPAMTCRFCPITIRKALEKAPGVVAARADFDSKTATVTFDPDTTTIAALIHAVRNAGYEAIPRESAGNGESGDTEKHD